MTWPGSVLLELLKYAYLQLAAEAFIRDPTNGTLASSGNVLVDALKLGNRHTSKFTEKQAQEFRCAMDGA